MATDFGITVNVDIANLEQKPIFIFLSKIKTLCKNRKVDPQSYILLYSNLAKCCGILLALDCKSRQSVKKRSYHNDWKESMKVYRIFQTEFCFYDKILLRTNTNFILHKLRKDVFNAAHEGHLSSLSTVSINGPVLRFELSSKVNR